jgi:peptidoglycan/xylan/chitin deacetylase (PgdA/CDA1 family)
MGLARTLVLLAVLVAALEESSGSASREARASGARAPARRHAAMAAGASTAVARRGPRRAASAMIGRLLRLGLPIYCAGHRGHEVALTFDDGPGPYTHLAIRKLARARERATFFDVGRSMDLYPGYLRRELRVAALGDHTYTHPALTALAPRQIRWQLSATALKIEAQTGRHVELWRAPYELHNATVDRIAQRLDLLQILWDVDSRDSLGASYASIIKNVEAGLHPGAIIELHENRGQTIRALTTLLPALHRRHLLSVPLPELLASDPPTIKQVRTGPKGCRARARATGIE